jgi:DNA-binding response OmpR family regulator
MPRVLIADDEDSMRTLVARAIAMDGHETVTAEDGAKRWKSSPARTAPSTCC